MGYGGTNAHIILENVGNLSKGLDASIINGHDQMGTHQNGHRHSETRQNGVHRNGNRRNGLGINVVHQNGYELKLQRLRALQQSQDNSNRSLIFQLSAKHEDAAQQMKLNLSTYLQAQENVAERSLLENLAYTLGQRRSALSWSQALPATSLAALIEALDEKKIKPTRASKAPRLGFVFTGQGAQRAQMGRELITAYPVFKESIDEADEYLMSLGCPWSLNGRNDVLV